MPNTQRILHYLSLSLIWYCALALTIGHLMPLEFRNEGVRGWYYVIVGCIFILVAGYKLFEYLYKKFSRSITVALVATVPIMGFVAFVLALFLFGTMFCGWANGRVLFEERENPEHRIVRRNYDCGAWDSNVPSYRIFDVRPLNTQFNWVIECDTFHLDKAVWVKVEPLW